MNILKKNLKLVISFLITFMFMIFILSGIYYLFNFNRSIYYALLFIISLILIYIFNLNIGKNQKNEVIINNLVFSASIIVIIFIINMLFFIKSFSLQNILYYIIILITSLLGILVGKRKKDPS